MKAVERPTFESETSKRIYEYVERHGTANRHALRDALSLSAETFQDHLERLTSEGYLESEGGTLRIALEFGAIEEFETDGTTVIIRPGRQSDFEGLVETIRDVTAEETYVVAETVAEQLLYEDAVTRHNAVESRVFFVATVDGAVVGWTHLDLPHLDQVKETARQTVGVRETYRGKGIGSELLERGLEWARANGYRKVYNSIPTTNDRALEFLTEHGWNTEAIRRNHYTIDGEHVDEVMMAYEF
ncbi:GNAT family N-acetyltransferase [Natrialbaceae archaeon AArc-T1-2]|uniref:GNAT family N-acetyltransferase n=1 Tax=Natrialbaceae archaeon AArc-T1-2 TaxID=3053904 RepID=UPI00255AE705|nr:GNAT family N-acetyltransferase [Natrialbaceae archaeon AArc-T1-2]WIV67490.1 GNAT family N-acetyltransferase [Natrialbaceae archaeon AArc-T1-2]